MHKDDQNLGKKNLLGLENVVELGIFKMTEPMHYRQMGNPSIISGVIKNQNEVKMKKKNTLTIILFLTLEEKENTIVILSKN